MLVLLTWTAQAQPQKKACSGLERCPCMCVVGPLPQRGVCMEAAPLYYSWQLHEIGSRWPGLTDV